MAGSRRGRKSRRRSRRPNRSVSRSAVRPSAIRASPTRTAGSAVTPPIRSRSRGVHPRAPTRRASGSSVTLSWPARTTHMFACTPSSTTASACPRAAPRATGHSRRIGGGATLRRPGPSSSPTQTRAGSRRRGPTPGPRRITGPSTALRSATCSSSDCFASSTASHAGPSTCPFVRPAWISRGSRTLANPPIGGRSGFRRSRTTRRPCRAAPSSSPATTSMPSRSSTATTGARPVS